MKSCFFGNHTYQEQVFFQLAYKTILQNHGMKSWIDIWNHGFWLRFQPTTWKWIFHGMIQHSDSAIPFLNHLLRDCMNSFNELNVWYSYLNSTYDVYIRINTLYPYGCIKYELTRPDVPQALAGIVSGISVAEAIVVTYCKLLFMYWFQYANS
jgi:hypothetical protein